MTQSPGEVDPIKSPALAALQALKYETSTPQGRANAHKDEGNIRVFIIAVSSCRMLTLLSTVYLYVCVILLRLLIIEINNNAIIHR